MKIARVCFATLSAAFATAETDSGGRECLISTPLASLSSQGYCDLNGEVSGVVLLSKRSALSKALFKKEGLEADRFSSASNTKALHVLAGHASTARVAIANTSSVLMGPFTLLGISTLHTLRGHGNSLLLVLFVGIFVIAGVLWYIRAERRKHEIYDLPSDNEEGNDWQHELWLKRHHGHRPQSGDSHAYRSPQPSARSLEEPSARGANQQRLAHPRGSPLGTAGSLGSGRTPNDTKLHTKETRDEALMHRKEEQVVALLRRREQEAEAATQATFQQTEEALARKREQALRALATGSESVLQVGNKIHGAGVGASKKVLNTVDKVTGKAITKIRDKMEDKAAMLEQRWNEARSSNM